MSYEHISQLFFRLDEICGDISKEYLVPYIMTLYFYVLGLFIKNHIGCNVECHVIVAYEFCG
jgi:hypothetical protein